MPDEEKEPSVIATSDQTASDQIMTDETAQAIAARRQEPPTDPKPYFPPGRSRRRWIPENA
jgi:hypothetical protein